MQKLLDPEKDVNKLFENVSSQRGIPNFFRSGENQTLRFLGVVFSAKVI